MKNEAVRIRAVVPEGGLQMEAAAGGKWLGTIRDGNREIRVTRPSSGGLNLQTWERTGSAFLPVDGAEITIGAPDLPTLMEAIKQAME